MSNPAPITSCAAVAETQVPSSLDGQGTLLKVAEPQKSKKKCIVLSLIRHGQVCSLLFRIFIAYIVESRQYGQLCDRSGRLPYPIRQTTG